jgi:hypothetical protein
METIKMECYKNYLKGHFICSLKEKEIFYEKVNSKQQKRLAHYCKQFSCAKCFFCRTEKANEPITETEAA